MSYATDFSESSPRTGESPRPDPSPRPLLSARRPKKAVDDYSRWLASAAPPEQEGYAAGRRYFYFRSDIVPPEDQDAVQTAFKNALKSLERFEGQLNQKSQFLYQRKAQIGAIAKDHKRQKEELEKSYEDVQEALTLAHGQYKVIPLLEDPKVVARALSHMIALEAISPPLMTKYAELIPLLESSHHCEALEFYKHVKRECKVLKKKPDIEVRVDGLATLLNTVEGKVAEIVNSLPGRNVVIVEQTTMLYEELVRFIKYTSNAVRLELEGSKSQIISSTSSEEEQNIDPVAPETVVSWGWSLIGYGWVWGGGARVERPIDVAKVATRIDDLLSAADGVKKIIGTLSSSKNKQEELSEEAEQRVTSYIEQCQLDPLSNEDEFRNGQPLTTTRFIGRYRNIKDQVEALRGISKALVRLRTTVQERTISLCEGKVEVPEGLAELNEESPFYCDILNGLEARILEQQKALAQLPFSDRVHAGWYYVARLAAKIREVRVHVNHFTELASERFMAYAQATNRLIEYLDPQDAELALSENYINSASAISRLFVSMEKVCKLEKPITSDTFRNKMRSMIYDTTDQILAKMGSRTLTLTPEEAEVPALVFVDSPLKNLLTVNEVPDELLPKIVVHYLVKGFLRQGYFSNVLVDPEFELVLHSFQNNPLYKEAFEGSYNQVGNFKMLCDSYMAQTDLNQYRPHAALMIDAIRALTSSPFDNDLKKLYGYCEARQILCDLNSSVGGNTSEQQRLRIIWINSKLRTSLLEAEVLYPRYFPHLESINVHELTDETRHQVIYKLVCTGLFASDQKSRGMANAMLQGLFSTKEIEQRHLPRVQDFPLITPLRMWTLEMYMGRQIELTAVQKKILSDFFVTYLADAAVRDSWRQRYDIAFMESAICSFNVHSGGAMNALSIALVSYRSQHGDHDLWRDVLVRYDEFRQLLNRCDGEFIRGTPQHKRAQELVSDASALFEQQQQPRQLHIEDPDTAFDIASWCAEKMRIQLTITTKVSRK